MTIALWQNLDEDDLCIECGKYPAKQQCKICFDVLCKNCFRRNHGLCSDCKNEIPERNMDKYERN